jgi:hypothetical protein
MVENPSTPLWSTTSVSAEASWRDAEMRRSEIISQDLSVAIPPIR